jgi:hypothetical protein
MIPTVCQGFRPKQVINYQRLSTNMKKPSRLCTTTYGVSELLVGQMLDLEREGAK